ncbi:MAG: LLM class flavin-dependent oxidoreductase, partial [Chloroflexi bacterium]|nr:LLM class flavin-dependent oxidoreductase [Chloroflexota bacterium]
DHLMGFWPQSLWTPDITPLAVVQPSPHVHFDPFLAMVAAAGGTERITVGSAVTQPLSRHPAHLAQTFLTLAHAAPDRIILGLGAGEAENIEPYGVAGDRPAARLSEALHIIHLLWSSPDPVNFDGDFWRLRDAVLGLKPPVGGAAPPIWLAALGPRLLRLTGGQADGWIPLKMPPAQYAERLAVIRDAAAAARRDPDAIVPAAWAFTVVDEDQSVVDRLADHPLVKAVALMFSEDAFARHGTDHPLGPGKDGFRDYIPSRLDRRDALAAIGRVPAQVVRDHLLVGTPDQLAEELEALSGAGLRQMVLWNITFLADPDRARSSFRLLELLAGR